MQCWTVTTATMYANRIEYSNRIEVNLFGCMDGFFHTKGHATGERLSTDNACPFFHYITELAHDLITKISPANAAVVIRLVISVCLCLSICNTPTFKSLDLESLFLVFRYIFRIIRLSSYMKLTGSE